MKNRIEIIVVFLLFFVLELAIAQQRPQFSQYFNSPNVINAAFAGSSERHQLGFGFRSQWFGVKDAPTNLYLSYMGNASEKAGLGFSIISDKVYVLSETHLYGDFSYKVTLSESANILLGLKFGGSFLNIDFSKLQIQNDPLYSQNISTGFNPNIGFGFVFRYKKYFIAPSISSLLRGTKIKREGLQPAASNEAPNLYLNIGSHYVLSDNISLTPLILARATEGVPVSIDFTSLFNIYKKVNLGLTYRLEESFGGLFSIDATKNLTFGYSYDYTTSNVGTFSNGSHEFSMQFKL